MEFQIIGSNDGRKEWNWLVVQKEIALYIAVNAFYIYRLIYFFLFFLLLAVTFALYFYQMNT